MYTGGCEKEERGRGGRRVGGRDEGRWEERCREREERKEVVREEGRDRSGAGKAVGRIRRGEEEHGGRT